MYARSQSNINSNADLIEKGLGLPDEPPVLDIKVRMIFDEDLNTMIFPKVKEMSFKLNSESPFEIAAKVLASRNGHPEIWRNYQFSIL